MSFQRSSRAYAGGFLSQWRNQRARRRALADVLAKGNTRLLDDAGLTRAEALMLLDGSGRR